MNTVKDYMTPGCECIEENETVTTAAKRMAALDIGALPICGADNRLRGMLTDRDITIHVIAEGKDPRITKVSELARDGATVVVREDQPIEEAASLMAEHQIRRLPVIDADRNLVGLLAQADLAREWAHAQTGSVVERISAP